MRKPRGILARAFAATLVIWLGLVITEPLPLDACPMHGVHSMHGVATAGHADHMAAGHGQSQKTASHQCTCIGDCAVGIGSAVLRAATSDVSARILNTDAPTPGADPVTAAFAADYVLPFANGPPAARLA